MNHYNPHTDQYIENSAAFAQPILNHLREAIHNACPDVQETIKWSFPNFMYKNSILCGIAAFKAHCVLGFWLASEMNDPHGILQEGANRNAMGNLGKITSMDQLPDYRILKEYIEQCMDLIDRGVKVKKPKSKPEALSVPEDFIAALNKSAEALAHFNAFSPSHRREYIVWISDAKREETRVKRINTAIEWLAEGKSQNWKYERKKG